MPIVFLGPERDKSACFLGLLNSFVVDFVLRQKASGGNLNFYVFRQLPGLTPDQLNQSVTSIAWFMALVLELTYTAWDLEAFALDCGYDGPPFRWDEERRFQLRCELDAAYFHLYLGTAEEWGADNPELREMFPTPRDAVEYIMETFPIVKRKDIKRTEIKNEEGEVTTEGTYITKERILQIYDQMALAIEANQANTTGEVTKQTSNGSKPLPTDTQSLVAETADDFLHSPAQTRTAQYQSPLDPPPGPPTDADGNFIPMAQWTDATPTDHIHPPRRDLQSATEDHGRKILIVKLILDYFGRTVRRDVLRMVLMFALNQSLARRIIDNVVAVSPEAEDTSVPRGLPRFDEQLTALKKNGKIECDGLNEADGVRLIDKDGLNTPLAKAILASQVTDAVKAFEIINGKRVQDGINQELDAQVTKFIEKGERATLNTI